jgi:phosphatidylglycerol lysyltransferase
LRSLLRGPTAVIRVFALLLVPWTLLLALAPAETWFGSAWAKWAWVGFDVLLAAGLFRALHRPSPHTYAALAIAVTTDAALTIVHALVWHAGRAHDLFALFMIVLACTAPTIAAIVLWGTTRRIATTRPRARAGTRAP